MTHVPKLVETANELGSNDCGFCQIARKRSKHEYDKLLFEQANFLSVASLGSLVPGWLLLLPTEHRPNMTDLYIDTSFSAWRIDVAKKLRKAMRTPVQMFEHGATHQNSITGCGVNHAHLHLLALEPDKMINYLSNDHGSTSWEEVRLSEVKSFVDCQEYLLYAANAEKVNPTCRVLILQHPESQYFRRVIADLVGLSNQYDYRSFPFVHNVLTTQRLITDQLDSEP